MLLPLFFTLAIVSTACSDFHYGLDSITDLSDEGIELLESQRNLVEDDDVPRNFYLSCLWVRWVESAPEDAVVLNNAVLME